MKKQNRKVFIINSALAGTFVEPLIDALTAEIIKKICKPIALQGKKDVYSFVSLKSQNIFFIIGGMDAMNFAASLALSFREKKLDAKCVFIPACPYNSVPFNEFSVGFATALNWCVGLAEDMLAALKKSQAGCRIGILEIADDTTGWLTEFTAASLSEKKNALTVFTKKDLEKVSKIKNARAILIITPNAQLCRENINANYFVTKINPGKFFDAKHISKQDIKLGRAMARAAVRFALKKNNKNILVANRFSLDGERLTYEIVPLLEAANTPRNLPDKKQLKEHISTKRIIKSI